jgi:HK97 family phage major capsid protein
MSNHQIIRRELHPQIRVLDAAAGLVEYVASDETIDCYREVVMADGWKFDRFKKNAPFVDSHNYESIGAVLGRVVDFKVVRRQLVETVKWAIDIGENLMAHWGFAMTQGGYLNAVSVGFLPEKVVSKWDNDRTGFNDALAKLDLGDDLAENIKCIYVSQQQTELSACIIGANPQALARAYSDNVIDDAFLLRCPEARRAIESTRPDPRRSYSFASATNPTKLPSPMAKKTFLDTFTRLAGASAPTVTQAAEKLEAARRGQSETELFRASAMMRTAMARARRATAHEIAGEILSDGLIRSFLEALPRYLAGIKYPGNDMVRRALAPGSPLGGALLPIDVSNAIFDLILINGAFRHLGVEEMPTMQTKFAQATANPTAIVIPPSLMGTTQIPADTALTGSSLTPEAATFAVFLPVSRELLADEKANLAMYLLTRFSEALAGAIDYCCFVANGTVDTTNGGMTGIWNDTNIATVNAAQGNASIPQLARADFLAAVAAVAPAALQRECKWWISPSFIAPLMGLVDTEGRSYLLRTPAETGDGTWRLVGFEVVWTAQAPAISTAGSTIAAFGHGPSYLVGIREELEVILSDGTGFQFNEQFFRALSRGLCQTRQSTGLVKLALANA